VITIKLTIAIIAFILSSGQIVFQTFQHHQTVNPKHGFIKTLVFILSSLSLVYLAKDIYEDFEDQKNTSVTTASMSNPAELDYWHSVYQSPSPEGYCAYLDKYPQGQFVDIAKRGIPGDCLQVKRDAEAEIKKKADAQALALKEKLDNETRLLAEKNAQLEREAKESLARIEVLEQTKTESELKKQAELKAEAKLEEELEAKFKSDTYLTGGEKKSPTEQPQTQPEIETKARNELNESLF
jgi:hypothetical protein